MHSTLRLLSFFEIVITIWNFICPSSHSFWVPVKSIFLSFFWHIPIYVNLFDPLWSVKYTTEIVFCFICSVSTKKTLLITSYALWLCCTLISCIDLSSVHYRTPSNYVIQMRRGWRALQSWNISCPRVMMLLLYRCITVSEACLPRTESVVLGGSPFEKGEIAWKKENKCSQHI